MRERESIRVHVMVALFLAGIVALAVIAVVAYFYRQQFGSALSSQQEVWGQFGDYFGGLLNPIFGFMSLMALLSALVLQSHELRMSRMEVKESTDALNRQNFETALFQLLRRFDEVTQHVRCWDAEGRAAFMMLYREQLKNEYCRWRA